MTVASAAAVGCALVAGAWPASAAAPAAAAGTGWHAAIQVPGLSSLPHYGGSVQVSAVSCPSPGNCAVVGSYLDKSNHTQAFVTGESGGRWAIGRVHDHEGSAAYTMRILRQERILRDHGSQLGRSM